MSYLILCKNVYMFRFNDVLLVMHCLLTYNRFSDEKETSTVAPSILISVG